MYVWKTTFLNMYCKAVQFSLSAPVKTGVSTLTGITQNYLWMCIIEGNYQMSQCLISLAGECHYEHFTIESSVREHLFQSRALFQWKCVRFQRTAAGLDLPEDQIALLCSSVHLCSKINTAQHTSIWVWGRQSATYHSILNSLYHTLTAHNTLTLTTQWVWMGEWVWKHQNLWH